MTVLRGGAPTKSDSVEMTRVNRGERRRVAQSLVVPGDDARAVDCRGVLLVDDLMTSGSTLRALQKR